MAAGEFVDLYKNDVGSWDGVMTCFFIDTAKNINIYVKRFATILREGGLWGNIGPLLYHFAEQAQDFSVELSWLEIRPLIEKSV